MTLIPLGRETLLGRLVLSALFCAQAGMLGSLAVAIIPLIVEALDSRFRRKDRRR